MLTLADVYLRIALLAVAKPNQLRQKDLSAVFNALDQWTPRITIGAPADDTMFVVDLDADAPPSYRELGSHAGDVVARHPHRRAGVRTRSLSRRNGVGRSGAGLHRPRSAAPSGPRVGRDEEALVPALALVRPDEDLRRAANDALLHLAAASNSPTSSAPPRRCCVARSIHSCRNRRRNVQRRPGDVWDNAFDLRGVEDAGESEHRRSEPDSAERAPVADARRGRGQLSVLRLARSSTRVRPGIACAG